MINKPLSKGPNIRIPIIIPIKGRGVINQGSGLHRSLKLRASRLLHFGTASFRNHVKIYAVLAIYKLTDGLCRVYIGGSSMGVV